MMKNTIIKILILSLFILSTHGSDALAKKKSQKEKFSNPRILYLAGEEQDMFNALSKKQQRNIKAGKIETGYNSWMVTLAIGEPFYKSEHHPIYTEYEEVWLYTKPEVDKTEKTEKIVDSVTNWPTIHKFTRVKICTIGDFFILFDRGVAEKIIKDKSEKIYGSCTIETTEEFIPIVNKKGRR